MRRDLHFPLAPLETTREVALPIPSASPPMPDTDLTPTAEKARFRRTLIQVLVVQVVALALLGLLQIRYHI